MIGRIKLKSQFARNVLMLMTGTSIAQAIPVLITPILTRMYSPDDLGIFAMYMAMVSILSVIATGRYEMAVLLPEEDDDAAGIVVLTVITAAFFCSLLVAIVAIFNQPISNLLKSPKIIEWLFLVPPAVFIVAVYSTLNYWLNRCHQYRRMSTNRMLQSMTISVVQVGMGYINSATAGLMMADIFGRLFTVVLLIKHFVRGRKLAFSRGKIINLANRYCKFPKMEVPASLFNIASFQAPYVFLPVVFGSNVSGLYFLVFRVIMLPISLVGNAMLEVFRTRATKDYRDNGTCRPIFIKTMIILFIAGIPPTITIMIWGQDIFGLVFGQKWYEAGNFAQLLAPMALLRLVSAPLSYMFFIREKLVADMGLQLMLLLLTLTSIYVGCYLKDVVLLIKMISISGCVFYLMQLLISYRLTQNDKYYEFQ